jgi:hypothetical protein
VAQGTQKTVELGNRPAADQRDPARHRRGQGDEQIVQRAVNADLVRPVDQFDQGAVEIDEQTGRLQVFDGRRTRRRHYRR